MKIPGFSKANARPSVDYLEEGARENEGIVTPTEDFLQSDYNGENDIYQSDALYSENMPSGEEQTEKDSMQSFEKMEHESRQLSSIIEETREIDKSNKSDSVAQDAASEAVSFKPNSTGMKNDKRSSLASVSPAKPKISSRDSIAKEKEHMAKAINNVNISERDLFNSILNLENKIKDKQQNQRPQVIDTESNTENGSKSLNTFEDEDEGDSEISDD